MYQNIGHRYLMVGRILLLMLVCGGMAAQGISERAVTSYSGFPAVRNYTPARYQAHGQNFGVSQDKRGMVYIANTSGVLEHDGVSWRTITTPNHAIVRSIACDTISGKMYVGARGDFGYLMPDSTGLTTFVSLLPFVDKNQRSFLDVWRVFATKKAVYFITNQSVFIWAHGKIQIVKSKEEIVNSFYANGKVVIQYRDWELYTIDNGQFTKFSHGEFTSKSLEVATLLPYGASKILVATTTNGLYVFDGQTLTEFRTNAESFIRSLRITEGVQLADGSYAFGTNRNGIFIIDNTGKLLTIVDKVAGLMNENVRYLFPDKQGGLWLALNNGISRVEVPSPITFLNENYGPNGGVTDITRYNDYLYFATYEGLYYLDEKVGRFTATPGIVSTCWSILSTEKGLLAATAEGVFVVEKQSTKKLTSDNFSFSLYRSRVNPSVIYAGEKNRISILQLTPNGWINSGSIPCQFNEIRDIVEDNQGWVWIPTLSQGIVRFRASSNGTDRPNISQFDTTNKLPAMLGNHVALLDGRAIFLTSHGVMKFDASKNLFSLDNFLDSSLRLEWFSKIKQDKTGNIWTTAGDDKKLTYYQKHLTNGITKYKQLKIPFLSIDATTIWAVFADSNAIWFGGPEGVVRYDPRIQKNYLFHYPTFIRKVTLNADSVLFAGSYFDGNKIPNLTQNIEFNPVLQYDNNTVSFEFAAATYDNPATNSYQYFLEGFEENWSELTTNFQKEYTNLPPGKYIFHVRGKNVHGKLGEEAIFRFEILGPWFKTWWAYSMYVLFCGAIIWLLIRWRLQQAEKEKRELERIIEERTSEVVHQKEEIELASTELANKNDELEKINAIVKSINAQINFSEMLQSILEKTKRIIRGVQHAELLVLNAETNRYETKAQLGWDESRDVSYSLDEAEEHYLQNTQEVFQDIYSGIAEDDVELNQSIAVMVVKVQDKVEGFLVLENSRKGNAFDENDFGLLKNLKEHITSAFIKTKILGDLQVKNDLVGAYVKAIKRDLDTASKIQHAILPDANNPFPHIKEFGICAEMIAAKDVGGDFYDFFLIDNDRLGFVMADVSGKGMPAALFMAVSRTMLKATALLGGKPGDVLEIVNDLLCKENVSTLFVTVFYGVLNIRTGEIEYGNGGHNLPFILRKDGKVEMMKKTGGMGLAVMEEMPFENAKLKLNVGDAMFLYTDGVTEAMDVKDNLYTDQRLESLLNKLNKSNSINAIMNGVIDDVKRFANGAPQADDITVLTLRYEG